MCNFRCTKPVTKWFMGTVRESTGFQPSNLNCGHIRLLTCLVFSSFRFKISLLSMQARFWVSLRIVWRSWLWSRACSDAERAGEHAHVTIATEQQALLEDLVLKMTKKKKQSSFWCYQKHRDSGSSQAGPCTETALTLERQGQGIIKETNVG